MFLFKRLLLLLLVTIISIPFPGASLNATSKKVQYTGTEVDIESDFSDNKVLIVYDKKASLEFETFEPEDFPDIDCIRVTNLTPETEKIAKDSLEKGALDYEDIAYNKILCLELANPGKENVLSAIAKLQKKEHILSAEPDYGGETICLGEFRENRVLFLEGQCCIMCKEEVAGYSFICGSTFTIRVENGHEEYDLSEAFEKGVLTKNDIAKIYEVYKNLFPELYSETE